MFVLPDTAPAFNDSAETTLPRAPRIGRAATAERRTTTRGLRDALANDAFVLRYQPRHDLAAGTRIGAEALIRWPHKTRGLLAPTAFLAAAEHSAVIVRVGGWLLRSACAEAADWIGGGMVSVAIAGRQLTDGMLLDQVAEAIDLSGLAPGRLELQLTAAMLRDIDVETLLMLSGIRDLGVGLALDTIGTGPTSLDILRHVPLTAVKLDRSGVPDLIDLAHAADLEVVAEGIESQSQLGWLADLGCDHGQGVLFGQPMSAAQLRQSADQPSARDDANRAAAA